MGNNSQISQTSYYKLPNGTFLEDFIYQKGLNFNMGSALKYKWRAGHKDGESQEKDLAKAEHYSVFEAVCRGCHVNEVSHEIFTLLEEARNLK